MNIKLIKPDQRWANNISSAETFKIQQLSLPLLAASTPAEHRVTIVDESFAPDDINEDVDLVGITVMTDLAHRAYHIAETYRQRGVPVVMGGMHPTALPGEALQHADAVVLGEGDEVWPQLVTDASSGRLHKTYRANTMIDMTGLPLPRRDLYPRPSFSSYTPFSVGVQTSRGCPYDCEFCSIGLLMGHKYRLRPVRDVIAEMESIRHPIFLVDDNLALNRRAAKELFTEMIPLKRRWVGEGTVSLAEDLQLLRLMKRSGCHGLLIGFESVQKETQNSMLKLKKLKMDYSEAMRRFHGEGIPIQGAFVFGFDHENKDVFEQTLEFAFAARLDLAQFRPLTPYPGTHLYQRLLKEGRLPVPNWWLSGDTPQHPLFRLKGMSPDELLDGMARITKQFYSVGGITRRFFGIRPWKRSAIGWRLYAGVNWAFRKRYSVAFGSPADRRGR